MQTTIDVQIGNQHISIVRVGPTDATPILLVHGFPLDHTMWKNQIGALADAGFQVICPDLPGCGISSPIKGDTSMRRAADQLARVVDRLDVGPVVYCGLSMGGYIGWQFCLHHREKLSGLIACHTRSAADSEIVAKGRRVMAHSILQTGTAELAAAMPAKLFSLHAVAQEHAAVADVRSVIAATAPETIAAWQRAMAQRPDVTEQLPSMDIPALVIAGEHDTITPAAEMSAMAAQMADATMVTIAESAHLSPLEQPARFNEEVIQFLKSVS